MWGTGRNFVASLLLYQLAWGPCYIAPGGLNKSTDHTNSFIVVMCGYLAIAWDTVDVSTGRYQATASVHKVTIQ
jgi:hypothetical protein